VIELGVAGKPTKDPKIRRAKIFSNSDVSHSSTSTAFERAESVRICLEDGMD
jgi:hypothetical protein